MTKIYKPITKDTSITLINGSTNTKIKVGYVTIDTSTSISPTYKSNINTNDITITKNGDGYMGGHILISKSQDINDNRFIDISIILPLTYNASCHNKVINALLYDSNNNPALYKLIITNTSTNTTTSTNDDYAKVIIETGPAYIQTLNTSMSGYGYASLSSKEHEWFNYNNINLPTGSKPSYIILIGGYLYFTSKYKYADNSTFVHDTNKRGYYNNSSAINVGNISETLYNAYNSSTKILNVSIYKFDTYDTGISYTATVKYVKIL